VTTAAAVWLFVRAMRSEPQRWTPWIAAGVLTGVAMEIKILAAPLLACCLLGVVICGPRSRLLSPRPWAAVAIALLMAAPNLVWQALHGFPILQVAANIAGGGSTSSTPRLALVPSVLLAVGPVLSIVLIVGLVVLLRSDRRGTDGWLAAGFLIFLAFLLITGGKAYYPAGLVPAVLAAGAGPVLDWVRRGRLWRPVLAVGLILFTVVNTTLLTLPISRPGGPLFTIAVGANPDLAAEVGWPGYVDQVGEVVASIPAAQRTETIVLTQSYQQAAALALLRPANGVTMPAVYSGHNGFWFWGPPPESATDAIVIGEHLPGRSCDRVHTLRVGRHRPDTARRGQRSDRHPDPPVHRPATALVRTLAADRELRLTVPMDAQPRLKERLALFCPNGIVPQAVGSAEPFAVP
jgi:Dolichyl-phosphate-mannose-protein mannosyltransferase